MISLMIWFFLWWSIFVLAPPSFTSNDDQNRSLIIKTYTDVSSTRLFNNKSIVLGKRRKMRVNRTTTTTTTRPNVPFDVTHYRSSWTFISRDTIRVRFRLDESFLRSISSIRFSVRHSRSGHIRIYDKPDEILNSTVNLYLHEIEHGKHFVCLFIDKSYVFCQDIIFNYHKYGQHDGESDEHKNTFVFLLTQYAIVCGILCILHLIYTIRKRRLMKVLSHKANTLRQSIIHHHYHSHEGKSALDLSVSGMPNKHPVDHLILNLSKMALLNFDTSSTEVNHHEDHNMFNDSPVHLARSPRRATIYRSLTDATPLLGRHPLSTTEIPDIDFDTRSYEQQSNSFKSMAHILEANKPWTARLTDNNVSVKHSLASNTRQFNF